MRSLDIDCNRIYSVSNAVNLKTTADELRGEGLAHVTAAGYLDEKQTVDLSMHQMVGCSFESLFKLDGQSFGLVTADEVSALALAIASAHAQTRLAAPAPAPAVPAQRTPPPLASRRTAVGLILCGSAP